MFRSSLVLLAAAAQFAVTSPAAAQSSPDLGAMLEQAQRFTVKVRGTALWPFAPEQMGTGLGTGFIIDRDKGWILTNAHVAKRSPSTVEIALGESETEWLPVQRIYVDNHLDIAVLKVATDKLPADAMAAKLGCTQTVKQGATVVAYGHPISLNFTATPGIVSSVRTLNSHEFVQMDANINPGNSGGPLLAADVAEVIGINTANISGAPGLGLALAIRHVCPVLDLLAKGADPSLPGLPLYWLKRGQVETLTVAAAFPRSSADKSGTEDGLKPGDIVQGIVGGPKLAPRISPGKTWSGLIGAMVVTGLVSAGVGVLIGEGRPLVLGVVGAVLAFIGQMGDLLESHAKRRAGMKDSGHLIPGHGGLLDRLDGFIAVLVAAALARLLIDRGWPWT